VETDKNTLSYRKLCAGLMRAEMKGIDYHKSVLLGEHSDDLEHTLNGMEPKNTAETAEPIEDSISLENLIKEYFTENIRAGNWSERTEIEYRSIFRNIQRLFGDIPVSKIERPSALNFKQHTKKNAVSMHHQIEKFSIPSVIIYKTISSNN
jgi:hypothetical protein